MSPLYKHYLPYLSPPLTTLGETGGDLCLGAAKLLSGSPFPTHRYHISGRVVQCLNYRPHNMGEFVLPAAPNWYCSRVSDCSQDGLFLYGAKNSIFVFDIRTSPTKYAGRFMCHSERVVGVSEGGGRRAVTAGEDGRVRLWDYSGLFNGGEAKMLDEHANHKV